MNVADLYCTTRSRCMCYAQPPSAARRVNCRAPRPPMRRDDTRHFVYAAFLLYDNDETANMRSMRDYAFVSMNWLTTVLTQRQFIHVQLVFWDEERKNYYTYSVDNQRPVFVAVYKSFARRGWKFVRLAVNEQQEVAMHNFLVAQLRKPLNSVGQMFALLYGSSGNGQSWFCSELAAAALEAAGIVDYEQWDGVENSAQVAPHNLYDYLTQQQRVCAARIMQANPIAMNQLSAAAARSGPVSRALDEDGLPISLYEHVQGARAPRRTRQATPIDFAD